MIRCKCQTIDGYKIEEAYTVYDYHYNYTFNKSDEKYYDFITFDIETSQVYISEEDRYETFMYHFQFCVGNEVIFGRTFNELIDFLNRLDMMRKDKRKIVVYVHNLAYEFQFIKTFIEFNNIFAIDEHVVLKASNDIFELRCSYKLSNMSLQKFIENTPNHYYIKGKGDLDYRKLRTPSTVLTPLENGYCYNDVKAMYHAIDFLLKEDTLSSIPLTSTGYVRRECRTAMKTREDRKTFLKSKITLPIYKKLKLTFRGGNTASNRYHTNYILNEVHSRDISSSYPYVMMSEKYPVGKFMYTTIDNIEDLNYYNRKYCTIGKYIFINMRLKKSTIPIPYLSHSKCIKIDSECVCYNGRVMNCNYLETYITNIDFDIIDSMYDYDELYVEDFYFSRKDYLSKNLRKKILHYFELKSKLKGNEEQFYYYMKSKNRLNSIYGMFVSSLVHDVIEFNEKESRLIKKEVNELEEQKELDKYNSSYNSFLNYQQGVFVTAYARRRLQQAIDKIGIDTVYVDTDSVKYIGNYDCVFNELNAEVYKKMKEVNVPFFVGKDIMGIWDVEPMYDEFITLGAKKYCYMINGKLGITVSGLNKQKAPIELEKKGGITQFKNGFTFYDSGSKNVEYKHELSHYINVNNEKILTGSYINMFEGTYTLGITNTMLNIIDNISLDNK